MPATTARSNVGLRARDLAFRLRSQGHTVSDERVAAWLHYWHRQGVVRELEPGYGRYTLTRRWESVLITYGAEFA